MKYLVITADDYGMDKTVNEAIDDCIQSKVVLSTNVMTNMDDAIEAKTLKKRFPYISVGIHYNFTVGRPLSQVNEVPSLIDESGYFLSYREIRRREQQGVYRHNEVILEMENQYKRFLEIAGYCPDYWNTRENVHVDRQLYRLFRDKSLEFGITKMRSHDRLYVRPSERNDRSLKWLVMEPLKKVVIGRWNRENRNKAIDSPDGLLLFMYEADKNDLSYWMENIRWGNNSFAETAIHPAVSDNCVYFGRITAQRIWEYRTYSDPQVARLALSKGIVLCNYSMESAQ